mmetsp:Transcript_10370/g.17617  ORF Transcript_10370/g.17617 Transcript_10370/m.17617 type:complete len:95 (-) Transcript_10370:70-354(-)
MIEKFYYFYHSSVVTAWMMLLLPMTKEVLRKSIEKNSVGCHFGRRRVGWMRTAFSLFEWIFGYIIVQQHTYYNTWIVILSAQPLLIIRAVLDVY